MTLIGAVSTFVCLYNDFFAKGWTDIAGVNHDPLVSFLPALTLPLVPFTISIASLGLLLTFRTNVSYARWNEARTAWGKVINDSRSIVRMGCTWARSYNNINDEQLLRLGQAVLSFSRSLMNRTLPPQEDEENFKAYTYEKINDQAYAEALRNAKHRPTAALAEVTKILVEWELNPLHQVEVEKVVTGLCDALGASERIFTSPVPTFYTRHTARFLAVWLFTLPLGLYDPFNGSWNHWAMVPVSIVLSGFLLGIEELATQMEEPFSILPMEKMCEGSIRTPVIEQVERSQAAYAAGAAPPPQAYAPEPQYEYYQPEPEPQPTNGGLSETDMEKIGMYFDGQPAAPPQPVQQAPPPAAVQPSQGGMSVEEMNRMWAQQSGSQQ